MKNNSILKYFLLPLTVGSLLSANFLFTGKSASAYCVYNRSDREITGEDVRRQNDSFSTRWKETLPPGAHGCCPGHRPECINASVRITFKGISQVCQRNIGARDWIVVSTRRSGNKTVFVCEHNKPK
ncbi:hypothetical protein H6G06_07960 [Anabaena sphaerica FACHB-251]|uniref:Uncharacterized protein n=1 Tax=Anabaena sphaerica FACHB-251 TaxID=2692883 RepID=A0A926WF62_9NOST|nr:hypothetical protein [Anabaena sphaerica]MBD2293424.1 hypothetical protein [Anabaena sphaerica FACHB-251]